MHGHLVYLLFSEGIILKLLICFVVLFFKLHILERGYEVQPVVFNMLGVRFLTIFYMKNQLLYYYIKTTQINC